MNGTKLGTATITIRDASHDDGAVTTLSYRIDSIGTANNIVLTTQEGGPARLSEDREERIRAVLHVP